MRGKHQHSQILSSESVTNYSLSTEGDNSLRKFSFYTKAKQLVRMVFWKKTIHVRVQSMPRLNVNLHL